MKSKNNDKEKKEKFKFPRTTVLLIFMFIVSSILFVRLIFLQVVNGDAYRERVNTSSVRTLIDPAPRGKILDTNGVVLADDIVSYFIVYNQTPETKLSFYPTIDKVMNIMAENGEKLNDNFNIKYDANSTENPYSFDFSATDEEARKQQELRFKKDNGLEIKATYDLGDELKGKSDDEKQILIDKKLLEYTAEDTYNYIKDDILEISYKSFFLNLCDLYSIDKDKSIEYFDEYFNLSVKTVDNVMKTFRGSSYPLSSDIKALIESLGLDNKKFDKAKERAYVIIAAQMRLQMFSGYAPIVISNSIKDITATIVNQKLSDLPGIDINFEPVRYYPFGTLASNVLGYLGSISADNSEAYSLKGYDISKDYVGAQGIEKAFENDLKGSIGGRVVKLNDQGRVVAELGSMSPSPGNDVQLTINKDVQVATEDSLQVVMQRLQDDNHLFPDANSGNATRGAAVMINVKTGEVISLASLPGLDPNDFATPGSLTPEKSNKYFNTDYQAFYDSFVKKMGLSISFDKLFPIDENTGKPYDYYDLTPKPFVNYATEPLVSPGSTFKPITAVAGLSEGLITTTQTIPDEYRYTRYDKPGIVNNQFKDWNAVPYPDVNVTKAIVVSNNHFFFTVGDWLQEFRGPNKLAEYAWKFGLGADPVNYNAKDNATGIEIHENFGQTFNDYSYRHTYMDGFISDIDSQILNDNNINIAITNEDSDDIKNIKNQLRDEIEYQILHNTIEKDHGKIYELLRNLTVKLNVPQENFDYGYVNLTNRMNEKINESIYPGNSLNAAIGQGMDQYTPLQLAVYMATLANQGERKSVHVVKDILDPNGNIIKNITSQTLSKLDIKPEDYAAILQGMKEVNFAEDGGTVGEGVFNGFPIAIAGKTGSATFAEGTEDLIGRTSYAVYTGFAPADNPEVAFSVVVFDGGHGGAVAPVVLRMMEAYFKDELKANGYKPKQDLKGYEKYDMNSYINEIYSK
ncbi:MAG: penicillin-binding transpeptidase domain-containing protein [Oscillospiraceae bacterium]|nr:penicillin-binding transpeptidase domain-containing protein [Oscillospiraceae bacterium]